MHRVVYLSFRWYLLWDGQTLMTWMATYKPRLITRAQRLPVQILSGADVQELRTFQRVPTKPCRHFQS